MKTITLSINNSTVELHDAPRPAITAADAATSYLVAGHFFSPAFKRGLWDGRERLLKRSSKGFHWAPLGLTRTIAAALIDAGYSVKIEDKTHRHAKLQYVWNESVQLRDYQQKAVATWSGGAIPGIGIIKMPIRTGKTVTAARAIYEKGCPAIMIVPSLLLLYQTVSALAECFPEESIGMIGDSAFDVQNITVSTVQTLAALRRAKDPRYKALTESYSTIILDECFVAGTLIDGRAIETIRPGDYVWSFDRHLNFSRQRVVRLFRSEPSALVSVTFHDGRKLICTPNHPLRTRRGWVNAIDLSRADMALSTTKENSNELHILRNVHRHKNDSEPQKRIVEETRKDLLLDRVWSKVHRKDFFPESALEIERDKTSVFKENEGIQSNEVDGRPSEIVDNIARNQAHAGLDERRERAAATAPSNRTSLCAWLENGISGLARKTTRWILDQLQVGHSLPGIDGGDRNRRQQPPEPQGPRSRRQKGKRVEWIGVESVEIHKRGGDREFGGLCKGGFVYNFEVEGNHTYVANGIGVHNCHHSTGAGDWHKVFCDFKGRYRLGLSATIFPDLRSEQEIGIIWTRAACGDVCIEIPVSEMVERGFLLLPEVRMYDVARPLTHRRGWSSEMQRVCIHENPTRNRLIAKICKQFAEDRRKTIVIIKRTNHIAALSEVMDEAGVEYRILTGKDSMDRRTEVISGLVGGEYPCVLGSVLREGVDIPSVDCVINAEGEKGLKNAIQRMRNLTPSDGKRAPIFVDFNDLMNDRLRSHSRARRKAYETEMEFKVVQFEGA